MTTRARTYLRSIVTSVFTRTPGWRAYRLGHVGVAAAVGLVVGCGASGGAEGSSGAPAAESTGTVGASDESASNPVVPGTSPSAADAPASAGQSASPADATDTQPGTAKGTAPASAGGPAATAEGSAGAAAQPATAGADAGVADMSMAMTGPMTGAGAAAPSTDTPWEWPVGAPEDFGIETAWLEEAADSIQRTTGNRYGMVVVRDGTLIYEKYWDGTKDDKHIVYSCTKSWGSSLIGIAVTQGLLDVQDEVRKWVPMPVNGLSPGATLEHVLTQSSHTNPPGRSFQYNSGYLLNTAPEVLTAAAGMTPHEFFERNLAKPMGLTMTWPECPAGGCAGTRYPEGFIQFGNQPPEAPNEELPMSNVRDQAKLGWLWANNGKWDGQQLIDPSYIQAGSKPGSGFRATYGYLMWIENDEQFGAIGGVGNCYVNIMPSKQLVIAVMGDDAGLGQGGGWSSFRSLINRIPD